MEKIYLGASCFSIRLPLEFYRRNSDFDRFVSPCLPVQNYYYIVFSSVNKVDMPGGKIVFRAETYYILQQSTGMECRIYYVREAGEEYYYAISERNGSNVTIQYVPGRFNWHSPFNQIWGHCFLESLLLDSKALILHSVYYLYQGQAILFSAPSGTGKTTHAELWEQYIGGTQVNGDRTLIQSGADGKWYACGFPIHGSSPYCKNETAQIRAIVILRQAIVNRISLLSPLEQIQYIYSETTVNNWRKDSVDQVLEVIAQMTAEISVIKLECNMEPQAAFVLHDYLFKGDETHGYT